MSNRMVNVRRDALAQLMTCPICHKLFRDATTVVECLHTFCKKCIYKKLCDEEMKSCPVCKVELGCAPLDKLRADHNVQDLRGKIFPPCQAKNVKGHEIETQVALTSKRKERKPDPIWLSLLPSKKRKAIARLPQICPSYLRIKDGNAPISYVQDYLKTKFKLNSDNEVEIKCRGRLLSPSLKLNNLVDMWHQTSPPQSEYVKIGSSGEDFMIVVGYARKV